MAVAVGMYLSLKMTVPIFIGGMLKMYIDSRFDGPLRKERPELFDGREEELTQQKEKLHGPGILFASGLIAGEAIMGIALAAMAVSGIYLGMVDEPSIYFGVIVFGIGAALMAGFSLKQMSEENFGKMEEWDLEDVQEAEMVEEKPKKKKTKK